MIPAIAVAHEKGGVGKTFVAGNLAAALVAQLRAAGDPQARVLVVDADSQWGATKLLTGRKSADPYKATVTTVLGGVHDLGEALLHLEDPALGLDPDVSAAWAGVDLLPANSKSKIDVKTVDQFLALRELLEAGEANGDLPDVRWVVLDCGYGDTSLTDVALVASDRVLAVTEPRSASADNLAGLAAKLRTTRKAFDWVHLAGIVVNKVSHQAVDEHLHAQLLDGYGDRIWASIPSRSVVGRGELLSLPLTALPGPVSRDLAAQFATLAQRVITTATTTTETS